MSDNGWYRSTVRMDPLAKPWMTLVFSRYINLSPGFIFKTMGYWSWLRESASVILAWVWEVTGFPVMVKKLLGISHSCRLLLTILLLISFLGRFLI